MPAFAHKMRWSLSFMQEAFGSHSSALGILLVKNVPGYTPKRERLLMLASDLGRLSEEIKLKTVDPESKYNFGWSCGKEIMNG